VTVPASADVSHLGIDSNNCIALLASVGKNALVAFDAVRMLLSQHVTLTSEALVAIPAAKMTGMPIFRHGFCVLAAENQLEDRRKIAISFNTRKIVFQLRNSRGCILFSLRQNYHFPAKFTLEIITF
jgi:hypothetical protein